MDHVALLSLILWRTLPCKLRSTDRLATAGCAGKLVVVFMHNLPSGHEKIWPTGVNSTDPQRWQDFSQHCHRIVNMTFDDGRWQWHDAKQKAADDIIAVIRPCALSSNAAHLSPATNHPIDGYAMSESETDHDSVSSAACTGQANLQLCSSYSLPLLLDCAHEGTICCQTLLTCQPGQLCLSVSMKQLC